MKGYNPKIFLLVLWSLIIIKPQISQAQNLLWDIGLGFGATGYVGEIGGSEATQDWGPLDIAFKSTRISIAAFGRRQISYRWHANFQVSYIYLYAHDKNSAGTGREFRNLSFTNHMAEGISTIEFHPIIIHDLGNKKRYVANLNVFIGGGIGVMYHNPTAFIDGTKVDLKPLQTEGPNVSYSQVQFVAPITGGAFVSFKTKKAKYKAHRIGITMQYRYTYFDHLDDISTQYPNIESFNGNQLAIDASYRAYSRATGKPLPYPSEGTQRGRPTVNDHYFTAMIFYSKRLLSKKKSKLPHRIENQGKSHKGRK